MNKMNGKSTLNGKAEKRKGSFNPAQKVVLHSAVKENKLGFIKLLKSNGTNIDTPDSTGKTALMWASRMGHEEIVRYLLDSGADHKATDNAGRTAVHEAAMYGHLGALRILAEAGADLEKATISGQTALHFAAATNSGVTKFLLEKGVSVFKRDSQGYRAIHWAVSKRTDNNEALKLLVDKGGVLLIDDEFVPPINVAARTGNLGHIKYLEMRESDLKHTSVRKNILHEAATYDRLQVVNHYLSKGIYQIDSTDQDGWTCLHIAATLGYADLALHLICSGAQVDARTLKGSTPLKLAVLNGKELLVKILIDNGADINAKDNDQQSIFDASKRNYNEQIALYLAEKASKTTS